MRPRVTIALYAEGQHKVEGEFFVDLHGSVCAETLEPGVYELVAVRPDPTDPTPRPYKQPCPDCDGTRKRAVAAGNDGGIWVKRGNEPCPSCSVGPKQTEQNKGQHDDHPERCPDCDGTGTQAKPYNRPSKTTTTYASAEVDELRPCPSCSEEVRMARAADIIRRSTVRTSDLISIGGGAYGIAEWDTLDPKEQAAWVSLAQRVVQIAEGDER